MGRGLVISHSHPPPPIPLAVVFIVIVEHLLTHIPPLLLPTVFLFSPPSSFTSLRVLFLVVFVLVLIFCCFSCFNSQGRYGRRLHACVRKIRQIWWICRDGSQMFITCAADVSSKSVRGGFNRFLMTPWMAFQNPSCYKNCAALEQAAKQTRENFDDIPTRTSYASMWVQAHKCSLSGGYTA